MRKIFYIIMPVLMAIIVITRVESYEKEHPRSFDESVYPLLASQLFVDPANYNTVGLYENFLKQRGRKLPDYFSKPLFKHPPVFPYLIRFSYSVFGVSQVSAFRVSLAMGMLLMILAYLIGRELFDDVTGICAALLMTIEPVSWICSQKIWMETTVAFFMIAALYLFVLFIKRGSRYFMYACGLMAGLAFLCKYPGILVVPAILIFAIIYERKVVKDIHFWISLALPFFISIPWFYWNFKVFGPGIFQSLYANHDMPNVVIYAMQRKEFPQGLLLLSIALPVLFWLFNKKEALHKAVFVSIGAGLVYIIAGNIMNTLKLTYVPEAGWRMGLFGGVPWHFYLGRLVELSPFYFISFLSIFYAAFKEERRKEHMLLLITAGVILSFYIIWGNYQSRYITSVSVPLFVLCAANIVFLFRKANDIKRTWAQKAYIYGLGVVVLYFFGKTVLVGSVLAVPNGICYF